MKEMKKITSKKTKNDDETLKKVSALKLLDVAVSRTQSQIDGIKWSKPKINMLIRSSLGRQKVIGYQPERLFQIYY